MLEELQKFKNDIDATRHICVVKLSKEDGISLHLAMFFTLHFYNQLIHIFLTSEKYSVDDFFALSEEQLSELMFTILDPLNGEATAEFESDENFQLLKTSFGFLSNTFIELQMLRHKNYKDFTKLGVDCKKFLEGTI